MTMEKGWRRKGEPSQDKYGNGTGLRSFLFIYLFKWVSFGILKKFRTKLGRRDRFGWKRPN